MSDDKMARMKAGSNRKAYEAMTAALVPPRKGKGGRKAMKLWIKDIDWDRITYTQELIDEANIDQYTMWVPGVSVVVQAPDMRTIQLIDRKGDVLVTIDSDAFSSIEVLSI